VQWLRQGRAGGEVLLVFENTEDVLLHEKCTQVGLCCAVLCCCSVRAVLSCKLCKKPMRDMLASSYSGGIAPLHGHLIGGAYTPSELQPAVLLLCSVVVST
jgi:hypothetical protein